MGWRKGRDLEADFTKGTRGLLRRERGKIKKETLENAEQIKIRTDTSSVVSDESGEGTQG